MGIKENERKQSIIIVCLLALCILVFYNIVFFCIPYPTVSKESFYITYGCTMFSIILSTLLTILTLYVFNFKNRVFKVVMIRSGYGLLIAQIVLDCVVMLVGSLVLFKEWITILSEIVIYAFFIIFCLINKFHIDRIKNKTMESINNFSFINEMKKTIREIIIENKEKELNEKLNNLEELINYTIPTSNDEVVEMEDEIMELFNEYRNNVQANKIELIERISLLFKERKVRLEE